MEWIRFAVVAVLLFAGLFSFAAAVIGVYRFGFIMNRMHASGIGDTFALFSVIAAMVVASGISFDSLKLILLVFFMWFTSPVSTHFLGQVEYYSNAHLYRFVEKVNEEIPSGHNSKGENENGSQSE